MDHSVKLTPVQGGYAVAGGALAGAGEAASAGASAGGLGGLLSAGDTGLADALGGRPPARCWACCWPSRPACCR